MDDADAFVPFGGENPWSIDSSRSMVASASLSSSVKEVRGVLSMTVVFPTIPPTVPRREKDLLTPLWRTDFRRALFIADSRLALGYWLLEPIASTQSYLC